MRNLRWLVIPLALMIPLGCKPSTPATGAVSGSSSASVSIPNNAVSLGAAAFGTNPLSVTAGTVVTWTNNDSTDVHGIHWVSQPTSLSDSSSLSLGQTVTYTMSVPGTYNYQCIVHGSSMTGSVVVH